MKISVYHAKDQEERDEIKSLATFSLSQFLSIKQLKKLSLKIFIREHKDDGDLEDCNGMAWYYSKYNTGIEISRKNRENRKYSKQDFLMLITHELVHIKQYILDEFKNDPIPRYRSKAYWNDASELEAYGREYGLYDMWKERNKKIK